MTAPTSQPVRPSTGHVLGLIVRREMKVRGTSKAYSLSALAILVLLTGAVLIPQLLSSRTVEVEVGALGEGSREIVDLAGAIMADRVGADRELSFEVTPFDTEAQARAALAAEDVELVVVDGTTVLRQGSSGISGSDVQDAVQRAAALIELEDELAGSGASAAEVESLLSREVLEVSSARGDTNAEEEGARSFIAYAGMMMLYMAILIYGSWTLQGVTEEKSSRVVEVLLATVKPWQLMAGKVIGIGLLGLGQFVVTVGWALLLIRVTDVLPLPVIPVDSAVALVLWFVLGFGLYSVMFAAAGALAGGAEDAQAVAFPISMIAIVGFLVSFQALENPTGGLAQIGTYVPFMAPFVVPIRVAFQEIGLIEHLGAAAATVATMVGMVWAAGRLYAGGALHFGGRMGLRSAWRAADR